MHTDLLVSYRSSEGTIVTGTVGPLGRRSMVLAVSMMLILGTTLHVQAADASVWDGDHRSTVRLIAGTPLEEHGTRVLRGGIELKFGSGWKMYWRHPGDAGVPPRFDFTGSQNIAEITVLWPAPQRFSEQGTNLIVYKDNVVLPLRIVPENRNNPAMIRLKLDYGICEKLCILAEAKSELALSSNATSHEPALAAAEARVPRQVAIGEGGHLSIRAVLREVGSTLPRMVVDIAAPDASSVDLFVEGPTADWALPLPELISTEGGLRRFAFELSGMPPGVTARGSVLRYTAIAGEQAIEVSTPVD